MKGELQAKKEGIGVITAGLIFEGNYSFPIWNMKMDLK